MKDSYISFSEIVAAIQAGYVRDWRRIFLGSVAAGFLGYGVAHLIPKVYTSEVLLVDIGRLDGVAPILRFDVFTNEVLQRLGVPVANRAVAREQLMNSVRIRPVLNFERKPSGYIVLEADSQDPASARAKAQAVIDAMVSFLKPSNVRAQQIKEAIARLEGQLVKIETLIDQLNSEAPKLVAQPLEMELATPMANLLGRQLAHQERLENLKIELLGSAHDVVRSPPSLPTRPSRPLPELIIAFVSAVGAALVLAIFTLVRGLIVIELRR